MGGERVAELGKSWQSVYRKEKRSFGIPRTWMRRKDVEGDVKAKYRHNGKELGEHFFKMSVLSSN